MSLDAAASRPGSCGEHERRVGECGATTFAQLRSVLRVEPGHVYAGRADAESERLPPFLEARMPDAHRQRRFLDLAQPCGLEQLRQVSLTGTHQPRFVFDLGIELARGIPQRAERSLPAGVIPDAGRHDTIPARYPPHLH